MSTSKQYSVKQELDLVGKNTFRWTVTIVILKDGQAESDPLVQGTGHVTGKSNAEQRIRDFTRWALKEHRLFAMDWDESDDDEDEDDDC